MTQKEILTASLNQLTAQKAAAFNAARASKVAELQESLNAYIKDQEAKYNESLVALKSNLDLTIQAKREEVAAIAENYATVEVAKIDQTIAALNKLIDVVE